MTNAPSAIDPHAAAALEKLADIAVPQPVSWLPQTWGWAVLAAVIALLISWMVVRWLRRREADRYRREALSELSRIEALLNGDAAARAMAATALPELLKRVALAAWPRGDVAPLSGTSWVAFLREHAELPEAAAQWLDETHYRSDSIDVGEMAAFATATRQWIERHRVSA